jgi:dipeptidyl aminopeptidase/acylaminoacyl peptidase
MLAKISCPVKLIHCSGDFVYPFTESELLKSRLADAGVDVELLTIKDACHFGNVTCADE